MLYIFRLPKNTQHKGRKSRNTTEGKIKESGKMQIKAEDVKVHYLIPTNAQNFPSFRKMLSSGVLPTCQYIPTKLGPQVLPGGGFLLLETLGLVQQQGLLSWSKQSPPPPQGEARQGDANSSKQERGGLISSPGPEPPQRARPSPGHKPRLPATPVSLFQEPFNSPLT